MTLDELADLMDSLVPQERVLTRLTCHPSSVPRLVHELTKASSSTGEEMPATREFTMMGVPVVEDSMVLPGRLIAWDQEGWAMKIFLIPDEESSDG